LLLSITTAGYDRRSICWEQHQYAERVIADPLLDPSFYGCIYAADPADDPQSPKTWRKANPSLGETITEESFAADAREAVNSPQKLNSFLRYRLNVWVAQETRFFKPSAWAKCKAQPHDMTGRACYLGLDLASTTDLTAAVIVSEDDDGVLDVVPFFWCPSESIEQRSLRDKVDYIQWAKDGHIRVTDGNATDYETIKQDILAFCDQFGVKQIGVDPWNATMLSQALAAEGCDIVNVRQGYGTLSAPMKRLEALVLDSKLRVNHPIMDWCAANCAVQSDHQGNIKPSKAKSTERIDGIAALVTAMAVQAAAETPPPEQDWNIISV
jgi:phage terminase large subunit-like protein